MDRNKQIIRTSVVGIGVNLVLVAFKMAVGLAANSIAVILDAVNNLSDALSSIITIVGTRLAGRAPDKKHPFGHGRIEYLTGMLIAVIVLFAGLTSLKESVEKILHPQAASYTAVSLVIIAVAVAAKFLVGRYVKGVGEKIRSQALIASGSDAFFDAILSLATLAGAAVNMIWGLGLEGYLGAAISLIIIKAGVEMLLDTLSSITGTRADKDLSEGLRALALRHQEVHGVYDLTVHDYGPNTTIASMHIEVDDDMPARQIHKLTRQIAVEAYQQYGVVLTVGIYAANNSSEEGNRMQQDLAAITGAKPEVLQTHGFYLDEENKRVMFDLVIDFAADAPAISAEIKGQMEEKWPGYRFDVVLDSDYSD